MTSVILLSFRICIGFVLPLISQPLTLGLVIIMLALFNCILISLFGSRWYGYILFLIFVGGLLVIFAYVAALCPNLLFEQRLLGLILIGCFGGAIVIFYNRYFIDEKALGDYRLLRLKWVRAFGVELASPGLISILMGLGVILLINLIAVVKICYFQQGSLRPFKE